jgi:hypothetical protein
MMAFFEPLSFHEGRGSGVWAKADAAPERMRTNVQRSLDNITITPLGL